MSKGWQIAVNKGIAATARKGAARGLSLAAEHVLGEARKRVPIEEATLERSGATSLDPDSLKAAVTFDTPYAVVQHEDMSLKHDAGREAKYLENAMNAETSTVQMIIAQAIKGVL